MKEMDIEEKRKDAIEKVNENESVVKDNIQVIEEVQTLGEKVDKGEGSFVM